MQEAQWTCEAIPCGADPASGAQITQLTSEPVTSHNIYCEKRYASADGTRIAIDRQPFGQRKQIWVCDLTQRTRLIRGAEGSPLASNAPRNAIYYYRTDNGVLKLMRLDMVELTNTELFAFQPSCDNIAGPILKGDVSPDEKWFVGGPYHVKDNVYSLRAINLETGEEQTLCEVEDMFNPHHQFDPSGSNRMLVQVNRGGSPPWSSAGRSLSGPQGSTLIVVDVPSGEITPLPVGLPETGRISGHLCWVGQTGRIVVTGAPGVAKHAADGRGIYNVTPGDEEATQIVSGEPFNHIAVSDDGRFFIVDNHKTWHVFVGNLATGAFRELCDSHTRQGRPQHTHSHAYMTPDNRHVIFNSVGTGIAQVYAARIPENFLEQLGDL